MKKPAVTILFIVIAIGVLASALLLGNKMLTVHSEATTLCKTTGDTHHVMIKGGVLRPESLTAPRCDKLVVDNLDPVTREIGFGEHDKHVAYDGISEKILKPDESLTITLVKSGTFLYHDHFHDEVAGSFTVK